MSGICGIIHFDERPADEAGLSAMVTTARHRASHGTAVWVGDGCAMAQLTACPEADTHPPTQPIQGSAGRFVIVGDVRIHDRETLRSALGSRSQSESVPVDGTAPGDEDLVLRAYLRWGAKCLAHLIGDYAFAIWDRVDRRLFLARDPMAMRPLYYSTDGNRLAFASEIGQLLASGEVPRKLFKPMATAWLSVHAGDPSWTFFERILQLRGAHGLTADATGVRVARHWDVDVGRRIVYQSDDTYVDHLKELLLAATQARLRCALPAGMLLSGGLDSCAVAGAAGWLRHRGMVLNDGHPFTTFSYRYEGFPECDERHVSEPLAKHWGMRIEEISSDEWRDGDLLERSWDLDGPAVGTYRPLQDAAMDRARSMGVRQLFMAARGDNMVGGFIWDHLGLLMSGAVMETLRELVRYRSSHGTGLRRTVQRALLHPVAYALVGHSRARADRRAQQHERSLERRLARGTLADPWVPASLLREVDLRAIFAPPDPRGFKSAASEARYRTVFERFTELGNVHNERRAAGYGLRIEDPWSDRRILEFVCAVPQHVLNRVSDTKRLARRALTGLVPPSVQAAASKILPAPFGIHALRTREARSLSTLSTDMRAAQAGLVDERAFAAHIEAFLAGGDFRSGAWSALTLEAWMRANDIEA